MAWKLEDVEKSVMYGLFIALVTLVGWIGSSQMSKLAEIEKELSSIKMELVQLQSSMLTEDRVREIVKLELLK